MESDNLPKSSEELVQDDVPHSTENEPIATPLNQTSENGNSSEAEKKEGLVLCNINETGVQVEDNTKNSVEKVLCSTTNSDIDSSENNQRKDEVNLSEAVVISTKPLCADYRSDSSSESIDSESDSSASSSTDSSSDSESESDDSIDSSTSKKGKEKEEKKGKRDSLIDLPPIENLNISVPEDACIEVGVITSIVDTLVVVESYSSSAALDVDTVLFLDHGKKALGKIFDILGPVTQPVYTVRFNNRQQIKDLNIEKDMKVYFAPKTEHTTFVFMSEVLMFKGSDASWKDNTEAPPEFQDFSDDEEERLFKNKQSQESGKNPNRKEQNKSKKRSFSKAKQDFRNQQTRGFRNPNFTQQRANFQGNISPNLSSYPCPPPYPRYNFPNPLQVPRFPFNIPFYSCGGVFPPSPHSYPSSFPAMPPPPFPSQNLPGNYYERRPEPPLPSQSRPPVNQDQGTGPATYLNYATRKY